MQGNSNFNQATFVGIDAHRAEHTALAINRFEDEKGNLRFLNTQKGIQEFLNWIQKVDTQSERVVVGIEGGGWHRLLLLKKLLGTYQNVYEVNPLYTKQRRDTGTRRDKSDKIYAKLIASVLTRKLSELPRIRADEVERDRLVLRQTVWFYEEITKQGARLQNQLRTACQIRRLTRTKGEKEALALTIAYKKQELSRIRKMQRKLTKQLDSLIEDCGKNLTTIPGVATILAAKIVAHVNGIERFKTMDKFISYAGISPMEKSSGKSKRYIKGNRGNRDLNGTFYLAALGQLCWNPKAKAYFEKKVNEGKTKKHALRCLMKRFASIVYLMLKTKGAYRG